MPKRYSKSEVYVRRRLAAIKKESEDSLHFQEAYKGRPSKGLAVSSSDKKGER